MPSSRQLVERLGRRVGLEVIPRWRLSRYPLAAHLARLFSNQGVDSVIDVGANRGQFRDFLREEVGFRGPIVSFEPAAGPFEELERKARRDRLWMPVNAALGTEDTSMTLNIMAEPELSSFLRPKEGGLRYRDNVVVATERVAVRRLDDVAHEIERRFRLDKPYLKLDTQGYDMQVIAGAQSFLARVRALQSEMSILPVYERMPTFVEAIALLEAKGFDISGMFPVAEDARMRLIEFDCVMVNRAYLR